jgi:hypothetical protein
MEDWTPKVRERLDYSGIEGNEEQELILCCLDGEHTINEIADLAGLQPEQVHQVVTGFAERGMLDIPDQPTTGEAPRVNTAEHEIVAEEQSSPDAAASAGADAEDDKATDPNDASSVAARREASRQAANYRNIFETELRPLSREQRAAMASTAEGGILGALCLDPYPKVIRAVLENPQTGLQHARLVARYHKSWVGLGVLGQRSQFFQDREVQRVLMRNANAPEALLNRMMRGKNLNALFKLNMSRELAPRAKRNARLMLRRKFQQGFAEECAGLICSTEGRVLVLLRGIPLDDPTTILLCRRTQFPRLLVMSLARFPGSPMKLIIHLSKQPLVKRSKELKRLLLQHPNCPTYIKRKG